MQRRRSVQRRSLRAAHSPPEMLDWFQDLHRSALAIRTLCRGRSVLLISHRFSSVRSADRIYVLDGGRVVEQGSHDELMALGGRYADLFTLQASAYLTPRRS
jgi:ATP-binding cassette, subfamily B, bacterial